MRNIPTNVSTTTTMLTQLNTTTIPPSINMTIPISLLLNTTVSAITDSSSTFPFNTTTFHFNTTTPDTNTTNGTLSPNMTDTPYIFTRPELKILPVGIVKAVAVLVLIILTIFGNLLVCISFALFTNIRSLTNYFILSLSISDLLSACVVMPIWFGVQLYDAAWPSYPDDVALLTAWHGSDLFLTMTGAFSLAAISIERNLAITNPFCYTKWFSASRVLTAICSIWFGSLILTVVQATGKIDEPKVIVALVIVPTYILPFSIMLVMYAKILIVARRQARRLRQDGAFANDLKAMKTIAIVVGAYFVCYTPMFLVVIWTYLVDLQTPVHRDYVTISRWLTLCNSCLNPIIYTCFNKTYRKSFKRLLKTCGKTMHSFHRDNNNSSTATNKTTRTLQRSLKNTAAIQSSAGSLLDAPKTAMTTTAVAEHNDIMLVDDSRNSVLCQRISQAIEEAPVEEIEKFEAEPPNGVAETSQ